MEPLRGKKEQEQGEDMWKAEHPPRRPTKPKVTETQCMDRSVFLVPKGGDGDL